ncbi:hypothetical protein [Acidihalobacter aeolianus]|uniref:hypothetical protein n=1 Tax=Acidihalobacter aeolianus TaxID=2792603 RepID=UPI0009F43912|nr:hypothetical protein [Acidihalobacter aeolianus]
MNAAEAPCDGVSPEADENSLSDKVRLVVCHKQSTSARLRFLRLPWGATLFSPLPEGATLSEAEDAPLRAHPAACAQAAASWLDLPAASLCTETDFCRLVQLPDGGTLEMLLLRVTEVDPPFAAAERREARFVDLLDARDLRPIELDLLRESYAYLLGG